MTYGVTDTGFNKKTDSVIKGELQDAYKVIYGDPNLNDDSVIGQRIGLMTKQIADLWELAEAVYNTFNPSAAVSASLDNLLQIAALSRLPATYTEVLCHLTGTVDTTIPALSQVANTNGDIFQTLVDIPINDGGYADATFVAMQSGAVLALAGTVTTIKTPVAGWSDVTNVADGTMGRGQETDTEARVRRADSLMISGNSQLESIRAGILNDVANVASVTVFQNETDVTDITGTEPHSIQVVVSGGADQDIGDEIWLKKAGGIGTTGNTSVTVTDSQGVTHTVKFTRPVPKYVHVEVTVDSYYSEESFPAGGADLIKQAVFDWGQTNLPLGKDIIIQRWNTPIYTVAGIGSITVRHAVTDTEGGSPSWETSNISIGATAIATMILGNITVILP